ncbi:hypothetical protein Hanom_Chr00s076421g01791471 [Helianthus anomalus]
MMIPTIKIVAIIASFTLIFMSFEPNEGRRLLDRGIEESWMKTENLLLSSLPRGPVRPPGNGCCNTGGCGNPCVGSKKFAGIHDGRATPPPSLPLANEASSYNSHAMQA